MAHSTATAAAPHGLHMVQNIAGRSLIIALPLPPGMYAPQQALPPETFTVAATMPTHDRAFWRRFSYSPTILKISTILRGLGLRQLNSGPGRILFRHDIVNQLADAVAEVVKGLPTTLEGLLDAAADYEYASLHEEIAHLLDRFGDDIWGVGKERTWLLRASGGHAEYQKDLSFEDAADQVILIYYLRLWILVKAFNRLRNKAQPRIKMPYQANTDDQTRRDGSRQVSKSSLPPQDSQARTCGDAYAAAAHLATRIAAKKQANLPVTNNLQVRRTARTPKPRKDTEAFEYNSGTFLEEHSQTDLDSADEISRRYKGKGRAWKKTEIDKDPAFDIATSTGKFRTKGRLSESKNKAFLFGERVQNKGSDNDATMRINQEERRSDHLEKETSRVPTQTSAPTQGIQQPRKKRRPRRKHLSEEVIRNSSDESEDDIILTLSPTLDELELAADTKMSQLAPRSELRRHDGKYNSAIGSGLDLRHPTPRTDQLERIISVRQPPGACKSCRRRRQKCDRARPTCGRCAELHFSCKYLQILDFTTPPRPAPTTNARKGKAELLDQYTTGDVNGEHGSQDGPVFDITLYKREFPLGKCWDKEKWRYLYLSDQERRIVLATMRCLGLKVTPRHPIQFRFDIENFVSLGKDINKLAGRLCNKSSTTQLIQYAEDPNYLDEEIDSLFETHSSIWSLDADRTKLLTPGVDEHYPKDLFYEESEDQKTLWIHLHHWIFLVALKNCKQMHGLGPSNMEKVPQLQETEIPGDTPGAFQLNSVYMSDAPEEPHPASQGGSEGSASTVANGTITKSALANGMSTDPKLEKYENDLLEALGQYFAKERERTGEIGNGRVALTAQPDPATRNPSSRRRKRKDSGIVEPGQQDVLRPMKQRRTGQHRASSRGRDLSSLFMSYLETYTDPEFEELVALKSLAHEISALEDHAKSFHTQQGIEFATVFFVVSFPAWLLYRRKIVHAKRRYAAMQSSEQNSHRHLVVLERSRLASQLRQAHETFTSAGHAGLRPEQVIFQAMKLLMNEHENSQTAEDVRDAFQGMENELKMLGEQLVKDGGAKFVMGDSPSVASLEGMRPH